MRSWWWKNNPQNGQSRNDGIAKSRQPNSNQNSLAGVGALMPLGQTNGASVLKEEEVREIRAMYLTSEYSFNDLAAQFGVPKSTIQMVLNGANWTWLLKEGELEALEEVRAQRATR
jgi:hypothetical protein